jgi:hypothetical protein
VRVRKSNESRRTTVRIMEGKELSECAGQKSEVDGPKMDEMQKERTAASSVERSMEGKEARTKGWR